MWPNGYKAASALRKEARLHGDVRLEEACAHALTINTFALKSLPTAGVAGSESPARVGQDLRNKVPKPQAPTAVSSMTR